MRLGLKDLQKPDIMPLICPIILVLLLQLTLAFIYSFITLYVYFEKFLMPTFRVTEEWQNAGQYGIRKVIIIIIYSTSRLISINDFAICVFGFRRTSSERNIPLIRLEFFLGQTVAKKRKEMHMV